MSLEDVLNGRASWSVFAGDARATLRSDRPGWARAMVADPPGQLRIGGELWDQPSPTWIDEMASVFGAALYASVPGAQGFVWAPPRTSDFTIRALRFAQWIIEDKLYVINASRRAPSRRHLAPAVDEWIKVRAPGTPIGPEYQTPWPRNVAFVHDPECAEACAAACAVESLVRHAGARRSGARRAGVRKGIGYMGGARGDGGPELAESAGTAERFFPVFRFQPPARGNLRDAFLPEGIENECPAAKPPELGAYLGRLLARPGDVVLDLMAGWGGLSVGMRLAGLRVVAVEKDARAAEMTRARLRAVEAVP